MESANTTQELNGCRNGKKLERLYSKVTLTITKVAFVRFIAEQEVKNITTVPFNCVPSNKTKSGSCDGELDWIGIGFISLFFSLRVLVAFLFANLVSDLVNPDRLDFHVSWNKNLKKKGSIYITTTDLETTSLAT